MRSLAGVLALLILGGPAAAEQDARQVDSMKHMKHMEQTPQMMKGPADGIPIAVLLYEGALLLDYGIAAEMFQAANGMQSFRVYTVSRKRELSASIVGAVQADYTFDDVPTPRVIIVPGGPLWPREAEESETVEFLKNAQEEGAILFSVCSGAMLLGKAGFLDGRRVVTIHDGIPMLRQVAPKAQIAAKEWFVDDGNVVTTAGSGTAMEATLHLIQRLTSEKIANELAGRYLDYRKWNGD